jgi:hypothetical protein
VILAVAVHVVDALGLFGVLRSVDAYGVELNIFGTTDGWVVEVTANMILLRPGAISQRAAL